MKRNLIKDALCYLKENVPDEKCQGVVIGIVSALMADRNRGFFVALDIVKECLPAGYRLSGIPVAWQEYFIEKEA